MVRCFVSWFLTGQGAQEPAFNLVLCFWAGVFCFAYRLEQRGRVILVMGLRFVPSVLGFLYLFMLFWISSSVTVWTALR